MTDRHSKFLVLVGGVVSLLSALKCFGYNDYDRAAILFTTAFYALELHGRL